MRIFRITACPEMRKLAVQACYGCSLGMLLVVQPNKLSSSKRDHCGVSSPRRPFNLHKTTCLSPINISFAQAIDYDLSQYWHNETPSKRHTAQTAEIGIGG
jgi:hypothetical protein